MLALASEQHPGWRVSDRLALAERAVWELLHHGQLRMVRRADAVDQDEWESLLLAWETMGVPDAAACCSRPPRTSRKLGHDVGDQPLALPVGGEQEAVHLV